MATPTKDTSFAISGWRYSGILIAAGVAFGVWLLSAGGFLGPLAVLTYDPVLRLEPRLQGVSPVLGSEPRSQGASTVLLVEIDPDGPPAAEADLLKLTETLAALGARKVVFQFMPTHVSAAFYAAAAARGNVVFGRGLVVDPGDPEASRLAPLPAAAEGQKLAFGVVAPPPAVSGVSRSQNVYLQAGGSRVPALEVVAAETGDVKAAALPGPTYLVHFRGGAGSLPNVTLDRALSGGLVPEMVRQRTALVGFGTRGTAPGVHTPTTAGSQPMSLLEFQGQALDTLLSGRTIREVGPEAMLLILVLVAGASLLLYQWLDVRWASWVTAALLLLYGTAAVVLFVSAGLWPPFAEVVLTQVLLYILVLRHKAVHAHLSTSKLLLDLSSKLRERFWPTSFYASQEHWSQVIAMVDQTLDLRRSIFLDRVVRDHRVREIKALNCSIDDIHEMRRDYERTPYSTAIETRGPIRLQDRKFFKQVEGPDDQYLVPLIFGGEVLGFWAFSVEPEKAAHIPTFDAMVRDYGEQISELLYHRQVMLKEQAGAGAWKRAVTSERQSGLYQALGKTMDLMERRLSRVESLLDNMHTAMVVYDLFGRTVKVNVHAQELLRQAGFAPYDRTALDLITLLTGSDAATGRRYLRHVIIDRRSLSIPVALSGDRKSYMLSLRPLQLQERQALPDEPAPFHVHGIVCELADRRSLTRLMEKMGDLSKRLCVQLRNDLAAIEFASSLMGDEQTPQDQRTAAGDTAREKVRQAVSTLTECQKYLTVDAPTGEVECYPVDARAAFKAALESLAPVAKSRGLTVEVHQPQLMSHAFAAPENLQHLFERILAVLAHDAVDHGQVRVEASEGEQWIEYAFTNTGFGMPGDRFKEYVFGNANLDSDDFRNLREAAGWVRAWGGTIEADSEVGVGVRVRLKLERFI